MTEYYIKIAKQTIATWLSQHTARTGPVGWVRVVGGLTGPGDGSRVMDQWRVMNSVNRLWYFYIYLCTQLNLIIYSLKIFKTLFNY
jgi:hypothetical protein